MLNYVAEAWCSRNGGHRFLKDRLIRRPRYRLFGGAKTRTDCVSEIYQIKEDIERFIDEDGVV